MSTRAEAIPARRTRRAAARAAPQGSTPWAAALARPSVTRTSSGVGCAGAGAGAGAGPGPAGDGLAGQVEPGGEGRAPPDGEAREAALRQVDAAGGGQDEAGPGAGEGDQPHLIAPAVGVEQEGLHGAPGEDHPLVGRHRAAGVEDEEEQAGGAFPAHVLAQV